MSGWADPPTHLGERDAADLLGVTVAALRRMTDDGLIPALRRGRSRLYRLPLLEALRRAEVTL